MEGILIGSHGCTRRGCVGAMHGYLVFVVFIVSVKRLVRFWTYRDPGWSDPLWPCVMALRITGLRSETFVYVLVVVKLCEMFCSQRTSLNKCSMQLLWVVSVHVG